MTPPTGCTVAAVSATVGQNVATVPATVVGEPIEIAFNAKYVLDALAALTGETVTMLFSGTDRAGIFRASSDDKYLSLVMPLRTDA